MPAVENCADKAYRKYVVRIGKAPAPMIADFAEKQSLRQLYVACVADELAGFVVLISEDHHMHLENVAVLPEFAGQGIGRALIGFVEQKARDGGLSRVELYTNEKMSENLALYPKLGYTEIARKQQDGFNRVFFRKSV